MQANDVGECRGTVPHAACVENVRSGNEADRSRASGVGQLVAESVSTDCHMGTASFAAKQKQAGNQGTVSYRPKPSV